MAAKSKKRLSKIENKLLKLEKLEINDVVCSICHSILVEPVTLPCYHDFCQSCFNGSIENNSLCCPLCRLRIGSWLRSATKQKNLVNLELWDYIKNKFSREVDKKINGDDINIPEEIPIPRLSAPGEIRLEYEAELKRLRSERLRLEQKHLAETELLIKWVFDFSESEELEAEQKYIERIKQDEMLAKQMQGAAEATVLDVNKKDSSKDIPTKPRLKARKIDTYLSKLEAPVKECPLSTDDNQSNDGTTQRVSSHKSNCRPSPEMLPNYGKLLKSFLERKIKNGVGVWNKENGENATKTTQPIESSSSSKETVPPQDKNASKSKSMIQSLLVSLPLPYTGILQHKNNVENRHLETGSVDSMQQELCYFKPIDGSTPTSPNKSFPLRVPSMRAEQENTPLELGGPPSRDQYLEGLCRLRSISLEQKLPSAFVIALSILRVKKETPKKGVSRTRNKKHIVSSSVTSDELNTVKRNVPNRKQQAGKVDGIRKLNAEKSLRRTRSMGSISKDENEVTPKKKLKDRKVSSDRKVYLRSYSKKPNTKSEIDSPPLVNETISNNKINLAVKNLSSPLENCDVKNILREQLRIEKLIEQEKSDFELAQKMEAEWNGRRQPRRAASKRQVTLAYALRPAKKLKV
ncbi:E3 ubiquitin-protein ligase RNF168 [Papilio machaon]|uniref:RING-type E3 ubiquitin transferase n=1 Tax=Papilio machaon TaxID=76193 RepID=A0A194R859_PAPMA|nr:E3 ubiquitin-protein ligase RNF168 [Papilio machaon]